MKRIQIRFISLISEKIFLAKRAHPKPNVALKLYDCMNYTVLCNYQLKKLEIYLLRRILMAMRYHTLYCLCLFKGTPSWKIQSLLKPTVTVYNYLLFGPPLSDCHHRGDSRKIRQIFSLLSTTGQNRKLTTTWSVWRGEAGLVQPDPVYTHKPAVSLFLSPSPLRHIQAVTVPRRKRQRPRKTKAVSESRLCFKKRIAEGRRWRTVVEFLNNLWGLGTE